MGASAVSACRGIRWVSQVLKQRVITACVLVLVLALVLLVLPFHGVVLVMSLLFSIAAWEWANLAGIEQRILRAGYAVLFAALLGGLSVAGIWQHTGLVISLLSFALSGWLLALRLVCCYPQDTGWNRTPLLAVAGLWLLLPPWLGVLVLQSRAAHGGLIWLVIAVIASADIGAYFAGRRFGRHKLSVHVSPGKTREGVVGGVGAAAALALGLAWWLGLSWWQTGGFVLAMVLTAMVSVLGDLFESMVKRQRGLKDSSQLLPGHGGVLDRIDGWTAAVPLFALLYLLFGNA